MKKSLVEWALQLRGKHSSLTPDNWFFLRSLLFILILGHPWIFKIFFSHHNYCQICYVGPRRKPDAFDQLPNYIVYGKERGK